MARKLKLTPLTSYALGVYSANKGNDGPIGVATMDNRIIEKFIKIAIEELGVEPNKILVKEHEVHFYNSMIRKLFDRALERRTKTFRYANDYSGSYVAGLFDCLGGIDRKGMYIRNLDAHDGLLLENLGIHTKQQGSKSYVMDERTLVSLIKKHSCTLGGLHGG